MNIINTSNIERIREAYLDSYCDNNFLYMESWDDAIIGYTIDDNDNFKLVYDEEKVIRCIMRECECSYKEAQDTFIHDNVYKVYLSGSGSLPVIVSIL